MADSVGQPIRDLVCVGKWLGFISQSQIKVICNFNKRRAQIEGLMFDVLLYVRRILILDARFISFWQISKYSDVLKKTFKKFLFA